MESVDTSPKCIMQTGRLRSTERYKRYRHPFTKKDDITFQRFGTCHRIGLLGLGLLISLVTHYGNLLNRHTLPNTVQQEQLANYVFCDFFYFTGWLSDGSAVEQTGGHWPSGGLTGKKMGGLSG